MCTYCMVADSWWRHDRPWHLTPAHPAYPFIPQPVGPRQPPWSLEKLKEYLDVLKQIKELEDKVGCPCEPNKADYIALFESRIRAVEAMNNFIAGT